MISAWRQWLFLLVGTIGLAGSLVTAQLIIARRGWRVDLTPDKRYQLSDYSRRVLGDLKDDVRILAFLRSDDARNRDIEDLLWRVSLANKRVRYQVVDVNRNPALAREYGVDVYGAVVVESQGRRREFSSPTEELLVAAIVQVTRPAGRKVYFLTGHGERDLHSSNDKHGISSAWAALMTERYEVGELRLIENRDIPADAAAVIVAGPRSNLLTGELLRLDSYLQDGGALLVLLDPGDAPGLVGLLRRYGAVASDDVVLDPENRLFAGDYLTMLVPGRSPLHPITSAIQAPVLMSQVRTVNFEPTPNTLAGVELLETAAESWSTPDRNVLQTGSGDYMAGRDKRGPVPVGVSALLRGPGGRSGRLVVFGDADFASNSLLGYLGNRDLLLNAVNWLAGEQTLIGTRRPKEQPGVNQFFVSAWQGRLAFWLGTVAEPAVVLLIGVVVLLRRRSTG
jgi:ABC-type uncharacterized transport system involved in gliding motility auxiliary subunit